MSVSLILLLTLAASSIGIFIFGVHTENSRLRATRLDFLKWVAATMVIAALIEIVLYSPYNNVSDFAFLVFSILISYPLAQVVTRRCRDVGWAKSAAYCCAIPYLGIIITLILLFKSSEPGPLRPEFVQKNTSH